MLFQIMVKYPFIGRRMQRSQKKYHALYQFEYNRNFSYDEQSSNETIPYISALDRCRTYDTQRGTSKIYYLRQNMSLDYNVSIVKSILSFITVLLVNGKSR